MIRFLFTALALCLSASAASAPAPTTFYAAQLNNENIHLLPKGGADAIGGLGDWFVSNGILCAVISDKGRPTYLSLTGGVLVDLWHCDKANDQWSTAHQQVNMRKEAIPDIVRIGAGRDTYSAWIETTALSNGIEITTRYALDDTNKRQLHITTEMTRIQAGAPLTVYGFTVLHPHGSLTPFTIDTRDRDESRGFKQPDVNTDSIWSILGSLHTADLQILLGSRHITPSVAYGLRTLSAVRTNASGQLENLSSLMLGGQFFTVFGLMPEALPWWVPGPGYISLGLSQMMDIAKTETVTLHQALMVSDQADAASITDRIYDGRRVTGVLDTADAGITILDGKNRPITFVRPAADGSFGFTLPGSARGRNNRDLKKIRLAITTPWSETRKTFAIGPGSNDLGNISSGARGSVTLPKGSPMSLLFSSSIGNVLFNSEFTNAAVDGERTFSSAESYRFSLSGSAQDVTRIEIPPRRYSVIASRGPEFSATYATLHVEAGKTTRLEIEPPQRVLTTPGFISADLHVHSAASFDSSLPARQRVIDFVAQGAEVIVASEHNVTASLQNTIEELGLQALISNVSGVEISGMVRTPEAPYTIAHHNIFPVKVDSKKHAGGTLSLEGKRLGTVIGEYKTAFPDSLVQLNHPRSGVNDSDIAFFNHLTQGSYFDPSKPLSDPVNASLIEELEDTDYRDIDFDAVELLNGFRMENYEPVRADWFSLLQQGFYKVATANSDSHSSDELVGFPRNYIAVSDDNPASVDQRELIASIKRGNVYGSSGPILRVDLDGIPPGGTLVGTSGTLNLIAESADWIKLTEFRVWINGALFATVPALAGGKVSLPISVTSDSYVFVEVAAEATAIYEDIAPSHTPFAFANPVFIDPEGDGWAGH